MYSSSVVRYQAQGPQMRSSDVVELPLAPVRRRSNGCMNWNAFGIILSIVAAATLSLGVADIVITYQNYMVNRNCRTNTTPIYCNLNNLIWTWVGSGVWGSIPVFILGIMAIRRGNNPTKPQTWFDFVAFLCAFIFTPAIIALSTVEVYRGVNIYYWTAVGALGGDDWVKAIIPIVIGALGIVMFLMTFIAVCYVCCCNQDENDKFDMAMPSYSTYNRPYQISTQPRPQMYPSSYNRCGQKPCGNGAYFSNTRPISTYTNFANNRPNHAYNFYRA